MFVSEKLVYLQLHKTGAGQVMKLLAECVGGDQIGIHNRLAWGRPPSGKRIVGSVRNPWDWYVSLWAYGCQGKGAFHARTTSPWQDHPDGLIRACINLVHDLRKPSERWRAVYEEVNSPVLFREWLRMVHDPERRFDLGEGYGYSPLSSFAGPMTFRYLRLYARNLPRLWVPGTPNLEDLRRYDSESNVLDYVIRTESLEDDLIRVLHETGHDLDEACISRIRTATRMNVSQHRPVADYYDAETIDLIANRERFIVEKYDYSGPATVFWST